MARIGKAVDKIAAGFQHFDNIAGNGSGTDRQVTARQSLGHRHHVGREAKGLVTEPFARAAKAADYLVRHQQDAVFAADRLHLLPISGRRDDHPARALHRFANKGGDIFRPHGQDPLFDRSGAIMRELRRVFAKSFAKPVWLAHMLHPRHGQIALFVHELHAAQAHPRHGGSVIGIPAADEDLAFGFALQLPVMAHHAEHGVIGFRSAGVEEDVPQFVAGIWGGM